MKYRRVLPFGQVMYFAFAKSDVAAEAAVMYSLRESDVALRCKLNGYERYRYRGTLRVFFRKLFGGTGRGDERLIPNGINFASFLSKTLRLHCSSRLSMKKYYRVNVIGHNDVILNRNTSETRFDQLQLLFYNLAARLQFYRDFGRSKPLPYHTKLRTNREFRQKLDKIKSAGFFLLPHHFGR